jgi:hypothetical protein
VITADEVIPLLLEACPSFSDAWEQSLVENGPDDDSAERLHYVDAGDFVRHIVGRRVAGDTHEFPAVFDVIERLLLEGDGYVRNLAEIGYIEGFQMSVVNAAGLDPERDFRPWLRPNSEREWQSLNDLWGGPASRVDPT